MAKNNEKDTFFPLPQGDVGLFNPDGRTTVSDGFKLRSNIADAEWVSNSYSNALASGWKNHTGVGTGYGSCGDVTGASARDNPFMLGVGAVLSGKRKY